MECPKICLSGFGSISAPKNRFTDLTLSHHFDQSRLWNRLERKIPHPVITALRITLLLPALFFAIEKTAKALEVLGNAGIFLANRIHRLCCAPSPSAPQTKKETAILKKVSLEPEISFTDKAPAPSALPFEQSSEISSDEEGPDFLDDADDDNWEIDLENPNQIYLDFEEPILPEALPSKRSHYITIAAAAALGTFLLSATIYYGIQTLQNPE